MTERPLTRMLAPKTVAVIGGGAWCEQVIVQLQKMGFAGAIWPVHPKRAEVAGVEAYTNLAALPSPPDAAFIGVNRQATIEVARELAAIGAGGAVCFASGFSEALAEDDTGGTLQEQLIEAAGDMPILGPNCYGFINALDNALLWPDQHGCKTVHRGVAILTQSSNISINLTMQQRQLPIAYMVACGNMAQTSQAQIAKALLDDDRVTAIGLHIEGFGDLRDWEELAKRAYAKGVPLVALKVGKSEQAQAATISHTASLAGSDAGAQAFLNRLGIARVGSLPTLLETLKLLHVHGPLPSGNIASISCSGGEASLIADMALDLDLRFPKLTSDQHETLRGALGPMVALNNPLDYHTYIWRDRPAMARAWAGMTGENIAMTLSIIDYPTTDATDWLEATGAAIDVRQTTGRGFGVVATLPELMPSDTAQELISGGVVPFMGLREALEAIEAATSLKAPCDAQLILPCAQHAAQLLSEPGAKQDLAQFGIQIPAGVTVQKGENLFLDLTGPFAVKGVGLAHKSEHAAVHLGVAADDVAGIMAKLPTDTVLIEEMVPDAVAELIIGAVRDQVYGMVITIGAGGILTELLQDTQTFLLPTAREDVSAAIDRLKLAKLLNGYRGKPAADKDAIVEAIMNLQDYLIVNIDAVEEVEINPLMCTPTAAIAADALIRRS